MALQYMNSSFSVKKIGEDGKFSGYATIFGETDLGRDRTIPGCFKNSLKNRKRNGTWPSMLWQHRPDEPVGSYPVIREDKKGLYIEGQMLLEVQRAREVYALMKAGIVSGLSIGFRTEKSNWNEVEEVRDLIELDLWEISIVTFPMLSSARISDVKSTGNIQRGLDALETKLRLQSAAAKLARV